MPFKASAAMPDDVEEWLDGFNTFSIYQVLPPFFAPKYDLITLAASAFGTGNDQEPDAH